MLLVGEDFGKLNLLLAPAGIIHIEHLGHGSPADVFDQGGFFFRCGRAILGVQRAQNFNRTKILMELLFRAAFPKLVGISDTIGIAVPTANSLAYL